ncbi:hypothetical protein PR202_gb23723 [Eleusine coracana subsp. coracana]|uniref:Uncharacterized protein n=1 Tax=Eleusine coracana subsp. coracana TaxID=191504 RepID=A0AAV5FJP7_ELECO|nr:hypothetical protein PR202_gb23723 [Eleusine coracana subsp. coracana]
MKRKAEPLPSSTGCRPSRCCDNDDDHKGADILAASNPAPSMADLRVGMVAATTTTITVGAKATANIMGMVATMMKVTLDVVWIMS